MKRRVPLRDKIGLAREPEAVPFGVREDGGLGIIGESLGRVGFGRLRGNAGGIFLGVGGRGSKETEAEKRAEIRCEPREGACLNFKCRFNDHEYSALVSKEIV